MHADPTEPGGTIVPTLRYRDVPAAIDWLCNAFGFEKHHVVSGEDGTVRYAELTFGTGMIMLGPIEDSAFDKLMAQPADTGGAETQICYLFVADADTHCAQARAAGAEIILDIEDEAGSGRGYSCRDPEGHVWNFGTYDPWKRPAHAAQPPSRRPGSLLGRVQRLALAVGLVVAVTASVVAAGWALGIPDTRREFDLVPRASAWVDGREKMHREQLVRERDAADRAIKQVREQLAKERTAREVAELAVKEAREQSIKAGSERSLEEMRAQLARERGALEAAQRVAEEARQRLALAERSADAVNQQLAAERSAREAAERSSQQMREQAAKERKEAEEEEAKERAAAKRAPPRPRYVARPTPRPRSFINWDQK
jgi:uncharacterized glyoxalase superfamily protein PhnB